MTDLPGILLLGLRFGLAICLYLFLFWALRILWRSLQSSRDSEQSSPPPLTLAITEDEMSDSFALINTENLIGRAEECTIQLKNSTVSNLHARIYYTRKQWWIEDLNSSNGTFLNDIQVDQATVLTDKDYLSLGSLNGIITISHLPTIKS
jgi:hypothetical protein